MARCGWGRLWRLWAAANGGGGGCPCGRKGGTLMDRWLPEKWPDTDMEDGGSELGALGGRDRNSVGMSDNGPDEA